MKNLCIILAAGEGTRMKTAGPKVMCRVLFKPMLDWVLDSVKLAGIEDICVIVGHGADIVREHLNGSCETVQQTERKGTGHAVMMASEMIKAHDDANVLILNGDAPFIDAKTIKSALAFHIESRAEATVVSALVKNPHGYGRIIRDRSGTIREIIEENDANESVKAIREINSGMYWFRASTLLDALGKIKPENSKGEYYLTDAIRIILDEGKKACAFTAEDDEIVLGANSRLQLNELNEAARRKILNRLMAEGVDIPCCDGVLVGPDATVGRDTTLLPNTIISGASRIGQGCVIGPGSVVENSEIGDFVRFNSSQIYDAQIKSYATVGPFVHIRPDSAVGPGTRVGNFVEIKNSVIGEGTHVSHLTYVGDSDVGANVNFGCGVVTVNFDGKDKSRCTVKDGAFIGCNTNLIAPVTVGEYAYIAAGSTITDDVPDRALAVARERQTVKEGWVDSKQPYRKKV